MNKAFLLLGTNMGKRENNLMEALLLIKKTGCSLIKASKIYETAAWGYEDQPAFLNQVLIIGTSLEPASLLHNLLNIEKNLGRERIEKWHERIIDIDILFYEDQTLTESDLTIPHPHIASRRFTLAPLAEIEPDFLHPILKKTMKELLEICPDNLEVKIAG